jgi:hypothetical protein
MRLTRYHTLLTTFLLAISWLQGCSSKSEQVVFRAFADGFAAWWSLDLYDDGQFNLHLGGGDFEGTYLLRGDTISLSYTHLPTDAPAAFLINREKGTVSDMVLDTVSNSFKVQNKAWMRIMEDRLGL